MTRLNASLTSATIITSVDYPNPVAPSQVFDIRASVSTTFIMTRGHFATGRIDLVEMSGQVIGRKTFDLGYASTQTTKTATVAFTVRAPTITGPWQLRVNAYCISTVSGDSEITATATRSFTIQVGQPTTESLTSVDALANGDFEHGLAPWQVIGRAGYSAIVTQIARSGSALQLELLTQPDVPMNVETVQGVGQAISVQALRGMRIEAYFMMRQTSTQTRARIRIEINSLTLNYYVAYDNQARIAQTDTNTRKSIFVNNIPPGGYGWGTWLIIRQNVADDFANQFGVAGRSAFQQPQVTIQIALELIGLGTLADHQFMHWDDVKLTAFIPQGQPPAITTVALTTSIPETTDTSQNPLTVTETITVRRELFPVLTYEQVYAGLAIIFAAAFVAVLAVLVKTQRRR